MSELTPCNRCTYEAITRRRPELSVVAYGGGVGLFEPGALPSGENGYSDEGLVAWFMELPDRCAC